MEKKKFVVIGSGKMGRGMAAHLGNEIILVHFLVLKTKIPKKAREK